MCGRYALALRPSEVRQQLEQSQMPVDSAPDDDDDDVRQSYNFAPGYHGLVYRADGPDPGTSIIDNQHDIGQGKQDDSTSIPAAGHVDGTRYKLQAMKWGLVPCWTKRNPDYGSMLKTINCRDDSLYEHRGMWTSMKKKKRCIVVAQGFYEWLKKNNGKEKIPHFTKRKDGQLMCFAGLYDCVQFDDSEQMLYTYTVITTESNKQLKFLHDRMPVILDNGSEAVKTWLDPQRKEWSTDLQSLLQPYDGELECFPVSKEVGKVGNNSPQFVVPVNSAANKSNIANFFGNQQKMTKASKDDGIAGKAIKVEQDANEARETTNQVQGSEDNAPLPVPVRMSPSRGEGLKVIKRQRSEAEDEGDTASGAPQEKRRMAGPGSRQSPQKRGTKSPAKKTKSATSNGSAAKTSPSNQRRIESFFAK
ncbi:hypothetical protein PMIN06_001414 [Paraphaeosphaeria minitans]